MKLLIINGPNLGRLGRREPSIYGATTMEEALEGYDEPHGADLRADRAEDPLPRP